MDYFFTSKKIFEEMIVRDEFIEYVQYGSDYKGTTKNSIENVTAGNNLIWRIDMYRCAFVEKLIDEKFPQESAVNIRQNLIKILIKSENYKTNLERYKAREGEGAVVDEFKKRLSQDLHIWKNYKDNFPNVVFNKTGKLDATIDQVIKLVV